MVRVMVISRWASCSYTCDSVTKQCNLLPVKRQ